MDKNKYFIIYYANIYIIIFSFRNKLSLRKMAFLRLAEILNGFGIKIVFIMDFWLPHFKGGLGKVLQKSKSLGPGDIIKMDFLKFK